MNQPAEQMWICDLAYIRYCSFSQEMLAYCVRRPAGQGGLCYWSSITATISSHNGLMFNFKIVQCLMKLLLVRISDNAISLIRDRQPIGLG